MGCGDLQGLCRRKAEGRGQSRRCDARTEARTPALNTGRGPKLGAQAASAAGRGRNWRLPWSPQRKLSPADALILARETHAGLLTYGIWKDDACGFKSWLCGDFFFTAVHCSCHRNLQRLPVSTLVEAPSPPTADPASLCSTLSPRSFLASLHQQPREGSGCQSRHHGAWGVATAACGLPASPVALREESLRDVHSSVHSELRPGAPWDWDQLAGQAAPLS